MQSTTHSNATIGADYAKQEKQAQIFEYLQIWISILKQQTKLCKTIVPLAFIPVQNFWILDVQNY